MKFWEFREKLYYKMLAYNPTSRIYQDDNNLMVYVVQISNHWKIVRQKKENYDKNTTTFNTFKRERHRRHWAGRLCGDMEMFQKHVLTKVNVNNPKTCEVCGIDICTACDMCKE